MVGDAVGGLLDAPPIPRTLEAPVLGLLALLLVIWIAFIIIGAVIHGLFWLLIIGAVLFVATSFFGFLRGRTR
jgi:hypothetical protein